MKHTTAPLFEAVRRFVERDQAPFYSPGHKGGRTLDPWFREHIAAVDLNNLPDLDTLHCPEGPILEAERLIADAWGVGASFILVQGSTGGNIAVALSTLRPDEPVLVQRNAHKSVLAGLVQAGARPIWLEPRWDARFGVGARTRHRSRRAGVRRERGEGAVGVASDVLRHHRRHRRAGRPV